MDAIEIADVIGNVLNEIGFMDTQDRRALGIEGTDLLYSATIVDYEAKGVLTQDAGFVITLEDGSEYQVTVVRSR